MSLFEDYYEPPKWLSEKFITKLLSKRESVDQISVVSFNIEQAVGKGEHYASCMYRIKIEYTMGKSAKKSMALICKTNNLDEFTDEILKTYNIYHQEMVMYDTYLPKFEEILRGVGINVQLAPKTYFINFNENSIVFEDLQESKFEMAPRANGLDREHTKLVLKKLAQMHAASVVYNKQSEGSLAKVFNIGMFNRKTGGINSYFMLNLDSLAKEVDTWPGWEKYAKKLFSQKDRMVENARRVFDQKEEDFNVLTHGDLWVNNVMYKYDGKTKRPVDVLMVDFQMCCWGSPAIDVLYFMATSLSEDLRENCQDEFIQYYHECLVGCMEQLNYSGHIPSLHQIQMEFLKNYYYSFTSTVLVAPTMKSDHSKGAELKMLMGYAENSEEYRQKVFSCEKLRPVLERALPMFDKKGILDM